jgi:hypothetical protein
MTLTIRGVVLGGFVAASFCWAAPAFADSSSTPNASLNACVGQNMRFVTQDNILPAPFNSAQGIGNVGKANPNGAQPPWGGSVTNYIKTNVC